MFRRWVPALVLCQVGCQGLLGIGDTTLALDATGSVDAPVVLDAPADAAPADTPLADASSPDAGVTDANVHDGPIPDAPLDAPIADAIEPDAAPPFTATLLPTSLRVVRAQSAATMLVTIMRGGTFTGAVQVELTDLAAGTSSTQTDIAVGSTSVEITLSASAAATPGTYTIQLTLSGGGTTLVVPVPLTIADSPGTIDTSFAGGSIASQPFGTSSYNAYRVLERPDGTIVFGVYALTGDVRQTGVVALAGDGASLGTYGQVGKFVQTNYQLSDLAVAADGSVVLIGYGDSDLTTFLHVTPDGVLDPTFGATATPDAGTLSGEVVDTRGDQPAGLVVQAGGGVVYVQNDVSRGIGAICHLLPGGAVDLDFADDVGCYYGQPRAATLVGVALDSQGQIFAGGSWGSPSAFYLVQLSAAGLAVNDVPYPAPVNPFVATAVTVSNDNPLVAGTLTISNQRFGALTRAAGNSADTQFGSSGIVTVNLSAEGQTTLSGVATQANGYIVAVGTIANQGSNAGVIVRYDATGKLDEGFGTSGMDLVTDATSLGYVTIGSDGRILVSGNAASGGVYVARYWN